MFSNLGINFRRQYANMHSQEELLRRFRKLASSRPADFNLTSGNDKVFIRFNRSNWFSPELTLTIEDKGNGSLIREVIGPNPATFTLTIFIITGGFIILFLALMVALSQISLGMSSFWSFFTAASAGLFSILFYLFIWSGRYRARGQMEELNRFVQGIIEEEG